MSAPESSESTAATFAAELRRRLEAPDADLALLDLARTPPRIEPSGLIADARNAPAHPILALAGFLAAQALNRLGRSAEVFAFLEAFAAPWAPERRYYVYGSNIGDLLNAFNGLRVPLIVSALALRDADDLLAMIDHFHDGARHGREREFLAEPLIAPFLTHPALTRYGPLAYDPGWTLDAQERTLAWALLDRRERRVADFESLMLENALEIDQPGRVCALVESRMAQVEIRGDDPGHFVFNTICIYARLREFEKARATARALLRSGYALRFRFALDAGHAVWVRDRKWLGEWPQTQGFLELFEQDMRWIEVSRDDPATTPVCDWRMTTLGGAKRKRCFASRQLIEPGSPVVEIRRLTAEGPNGEFDRLSDAAFEASGWKRACEQLDAEAIPVAALFPDTRTYRFSVKTPAVAHVFYDVARDPAALDPARVVRIAADHAPDPICFEWVKGRASADRQRAFEPLIGDGGHGEPINLLWRALKAGLRAPLLAEIDRLPQPQADKLFSALATFDDAGLRAAATRHFDLPELPAMMDLTFSSRLTLADHAKFADFGAAHPRWRAGLRAAMRDFALHLYSNYHPGVNWFFKGLLNYRLAKAGHLLFFLIHHPHDDPVLGKVVDEGWLPNGLGTGAVDHYGNTRPFYFRAAVLHLAARAPERLAAWLETETVQFWCDMAMDRETLCMAKALLKSLRR